MDELVRLVETFPRENMEVALDTEDVSLFKQHHSKLMYKVGHNSWVGFWRMRHMRL